MEKIWEIRDGLLKKLVKLKRPEENIIFKCSEDWIRYFRHVSEERFCTITEALQQMDSPSTFEIVHDPSTKDNEFSIKYILK